MLRFFVESSGILEQENKILISGGDVNHIKNVLRMNPGEELWISDGEEKEYYCTIQNISEDCIECKIHYAQVPIYELPSKIVLFQCLPKGDKMEMIIQKAVELGASEIVPVASRRCVVKLDEKKAEKKTQRWQQIAEGAAKQSKRMKIPAVHAPVNFQTALSMAEDLDVRWIPYELENGMKQTKEYLSNLKPGQSIGIFIGPEGGFEEGEIELAKKKGILPISLGKRILRTETAGLAILSVLMFQLEE